MLHFVPTPIGNLGDITLRAIDILNKVDIILAEDTRTSGKLLKHHGIETPLKPFHQHNEHKVLSSIIQRLLEGEDMALISDAGTPGISDPGFLLVREAIKHGIEIDVLPGATALIPALVLSGFPSDKFYFTGFLPQKKGRQTALKQLQSHSDTIILYESPYRLLKLLKEVHEYFPERPIAVVREISKIHQECIRGSAHHLLEVLGSRSSIKGEIVVVIGPQ